ncbi:MAG: phage holin family protein [Thermoleophilaceae bacterium]
MAGGNGIAPPGSAEKQLGEIVNEISEKATLLVHEEIELAKAEVTQKVSRIAKGAVLATVGGIFLVFMLIYFLQALALFLDDILNVNPSGVWIGYLIVTGGLLLLGVIAILIAVRLFKRGAPPTPELAIAEARKTRDMLEEARSS